MPPPPHHPHHPPQQPPQSHHPPHHHHPPPPQYQYYPYPHPHQKPSSKTLASCILATSFLTIILVAGAIACYILFHPQDPSISVTSIKFISYTPTTNTTANFTFLQYASVRNPNRYAFSHHGSSFQLISTSSGPLGFIYIPAGEIGGGRTQSVTANFVVKSVPVGPGPTLEVETRMNLVGDVKVFNVFAHHVEKSVRCRVSVKVSDGSLLGYHC